MTTTVRVHVGGAYRAIVVETTAHHVATHVVDGDYPGSPNPGGDRYFSLPHPAHATYEITETYIQAELDEAKKILTINEAAHGHE